jgi:hypothetical protein
MTMQGDGDGKVTRRHVADALRRLRGESGRTEQEAAAYLDCTLKRMSRIEKGLATVRVGEVKALLDLYAPAVDERDAILDKARQASARCWWHPYADMIDEPYETQLILEDEALALRTYQPNLVPGLLQTERYAWELIGTQSDLPLESVRRRASLRMMRRQVLAREDAPSMSVILDEAVLRRPVGGNAVMREQYVRLAEAASTPGIAIQVLPFRVGPQHTLGLGFHIFDLAGDDSRVVELELLDRVCFVAESREAARYARAFDQASAQALDIRRSRELLEQLASAA